MGSPTDATRPNLGPVVTGDGTPTEVQFPHLDDATVDVIRRNLLVGGEPGGGKSALHNLAVVHAALDADDGAPGDGEG
jgi:hypothetical protein